MSRTYELAAEAQRAQNEIARGQTDLARRQGALAEDRYNAWKEGYLPVERLALENVRRGIDVPKFRSRGRNAVMQRAGPEMEREVRTASTGRGISADSPATVAGVRAKEKEKGAELTLADMSSEDRARTLDRARRGQVVGIGSGVPREVIEGYGTAAGVMGAAGERIGSAAASAMGVSSAVTKAQQEMNLQNWQNQYDTQLRQYQLDVQRAQAEAAAHNQMVNTGISVAAMVVVKVIVSCVPEGTLVDTPLGPQRIETLRAGDRIIGPEGTVVTVLMKHEYAESADRPERWYEFRLARGGLIRACDEHVVAGRPLREYAEQHLPEIGGQKIMGWRHLAHVQRSFDLLTNASDGGYSMAGVPMATMIPRQAELAAALSKGITP